MVAFVDDDADDLELLQETLDKSMYSGKSVQFVNGQELMDFLRSSPVKPLVITLDLNMPVKNGFDALTEIQSDNELRQIPVIILSASSNRDDEVRCLSLGCSMFVRKPDSMQGYTDLIDRLLKFI